jgi:hypothetical protein
LFNLLFQKVFCCCTAFQVNMIELEFFAFAGNFGSSQSPLIRIVAY